MPILRILQIGLLLSLAITRLSHAGGDLDSLDDRIAISKIILQHKIDFLDRNGRPHKPTILATLLLDEKRDVRIEHALSTALPIRFISKARQRQKRDCWVDRESGKPVMGIDIGPFSRNADGSVAVEAGGSLCIMGTESSMYTLHWSGGKWVLDKVAPLMII